MEAKTQIGRAPAVTDDQIIEVGLKLESEGTPISAWKLRSVIGAGSPPRLIKVWEAYKTENGGAMAVAEQKEDSVLPPEVNDNLRLMLGQLNESIETLAIQTNNAAVRAADKRVQSEYEASKQAKENAEQELSEATNVINQADSKIAHLEEIISDKDVELRSLSGQLEVSRTESKGLQKQLDKALSQIETLKTDGENLQIKFNEANISARTAESNVGRLERELNNSTESIDQKSKELNIAQKIETQISTRLEAANERTKELESKLSKTEGTAENKIEKLHTELTKKSEELGQANEKSQAATNAMMGYKKKLEEYELTINNLKKAGKGKVQ
ncbi:MAG: colicin import membrane protein [Oleiphilaceae bacterium]|jgi:colicin import membrane protein